MGHGRFHNQKHQTCYTRFVTKQTSLLTLHERDRQRNDSFTGAWKVNEQIASPSAFSIVKLNSAQ